MKKHTYIIVIVLMALSTMSCGNDDKRDMEDNTQAIMVKVNEGNSEATHPFYQLAEKFKQKTAQI